MPKAILFDIDGTLVDSNQFHVLAWAEVLRAFGQEFRLARIHAEVGKGADNFVKGLLPDASAADVKALGKAHAKVFARDYMHRLKAFPGARALLRRCHEEKLTVILATSASEKEVKRHLDVLDARKFVDGWVTADDVDHTKPCPDIYEAAARKAGVAPDEALAVGDSPFDIESATAAGMRIVAVRSGLFPDDDLRGALAVYDNVEELLDRFEESPLSRA